MKIIDTIISTLAKPDDQGDNWYAWASNQCSHALFGCVIGLLFQSVAIGILLIPFAIKEAVDFYRSPTLRTAKDCALDLCFAGIGLIVVTNPFMGTIFLLSALFIGVVPRITENK